MPDTNLGILEKMQEKHFKTENYCPNLIYEDEYFALGVLKTWDEYKSHPMADSWNCEQKYFEENINRLFYYFVCLNKDQTYPYRYLLILTDFTLIGNPLWCIKENGEKTKTYHYDPDLIEEMRTYLKAEHRRKEQLRKEKEAQEKTESEQIKATTEFIKAVNYAEHAESAVEDIAYEVSSEEFQFKGLKRSVIDHGKKCYIKGYNQRKDDFSRFLISHGYFSKDELAVINNKFNAFLTGAPELELETVERYINTNGGILVNQGGKWVRPRHVELTDVQKDIFNYYTQLTDETPFLRIQKPRQRGVSTILKIIAQIEALGGKKVLYAGYEPNVPYFKGVNNLTYYRLYSYCDGFIENVLRGRRFDLIIMDEMISFMVPYDVHVRLVSALNEGGRMILVGTPPYCEAKNYKALKEYFEMSEYPIVGETAGMIHYCIAPSEEDEEKAEKWPQSRNECLGQFLD